MDPLTQAGHLDCLVVDNAAEESAVYELLWDLWTRWPEVRARERRARAELRAAILRMVAAGSVGLGWTFWLDHARFEAVPAAEVAEVLEWPESWRPGHRYLELQLMDRDAPRGECVEWKDSVRDSREQERDDSIWLLGSPHDCSGTDYYELQPGLYRGEHWQDGSLFLHSEKWALLEPSIERAIPEYEPFGCVDVGRASWAQGIGALRALSGFAREEPLPTELKIRLHFPTAASEDEFFRDLPASCSLLAETCEQLAGWLERRLNDVDSVAILGL